LEALYNWIEEQKVPDEVVLEKFGEVVLPALGKAFKKPLEENNIDPETVGQEMTAWITANFPLIQEAKGD